jgi:DHA2 family multidrug resistance protein
VVPTAVMVGALYLTLERQPMQLAAEGGRLGRHRHHGDRPVALQTVLEEGNKDDWFGLALHRRLSVIAAVSLSLFIWIELTVKSR